MRVKVLVNFDSPVHFRQLLADGSLTDLVESEEHPRGTVVEHPDCWQLAIDGIAVAVDDEARAKVAQFRDPLRRNPEFARNPAVPALFWLPGDDPAGPGRVASTAEQPAGLLDEHKELIEDYRTPPTDEPPL